MQVKIVDSNADEHVSLTADLIEEVFHKDNTGLRTYATENRVKQLQSTMNQLYTCLLAYLLHPEDNVSLAMLHALISKKSTFACFTRSYILEHKETYPKIYMEMLSED